MNTKRTCRWIFRLVAVLWIIGGIARESHALEMTPGFIAVETAFTYSEGLFDIYEEKHKTPLYGGRVEMYRGYSINALPGMEYGISAFFLSLAHNTSFRADIDPLPNQVHQEDFEIRARINVAAFMARAGYTVDLHVMRVGASLGIGTCFIYQEIDWDMGNPDSSFRDSDLERTDTIKPVFDLGILFIFPPGDTLSWGLSARLRIMPLNAQLASQTTSYGPWKVENVWEAGIFVRIAIR